MKTLIEINELNNPDKLKIGTKLSLKEDRILHWLEEGAQPTDTAHDILRTAGVAHKWHLMKQGLDETAVEKEMKKWALEREDVLERRRQRAEAKVAEKKASAEKKVAEKYLLGEIWEIYDEGTGTYEKYVKEQNTQRYIPLEEYIQTKLPGSI